MSTSQHAPFTPDLWWPDLFATLTPADKDIFIQSLAANWHEGWVPSREDVADLIAVHHGDLTPLQAARRSADRATILTTARAV
ncbi:antitoxin VbhA family protein [Actinomyces slackii]|uniref:Uncharacterized protein n=1 Tax=Actinomyces slackii TaxID=52774 RepID=A0A3S4UNQ7_9ACTO|nr:antitoxin VbhA family protein [Actinomyces slackii]VEG74751.1 Uncharacterised protein [Actinomyces slackii]